MEGVSSEISTILLEKNCFRWPSLLNMAAKVLRIVSCEPFDVPKDVSKQKPWHYALQTAPREIRGGGYQKATFSWL